MSETSNMLSDSLIMKRISEFKFTTENTSRPFDPTTQVNAASVNLRLSNTYWAPKITHAPVTFMAEAFGSETVNRYKKVVLKYDGKIVLKPGQSILCRTYERFYIPTDLAGRLHSRSSFSRLGIEVAGTGDFINPGWEGHMPLLIRNNSNIAVHLKPFMSVVQLCFDEISGSVKTPYPEQETVAKYANDEGGPSAIWQTICRQGLQDSEFRDRQIDIDQIIQFGKRLNAPTLKLFLRSLSEHSKLETAKDVATAFKQTLKNHILRVRVLSLVCMAILSLILYFLFSWLFSSFANPKIISTFASIVVGVFGIYWLNSLISVYNSSDQLSNFWKEVGSKDLK